MKLNEVYYKYEIGQKVIITDTSDDEQYVIGAIGTVKSRTVRLHYTGSGHVYTGRSKVYQLEEFPNAKSIEEEYLTWRNIYDKPIVTDQDFKNIFG